MGRLEGKVALITGAARGQGRSHAIRLAEEGADIIAVDFDGDIGSVPYPTATRADLEQTVSLVGALGRSVVAEFGDVRDGAALAAAVATGVSRLGHIDIVCANAGIVSYGPSWELSDQQWTEMIDVNLTGVWRTLKAVVPTMIDAGRGGAIIMTSSGAGLHGSPNVAHYSASKHGVVGLMKSVARELAPHFIRVNTIHPTNVATDMILNEPTYRLFRPDLADPQARDVMSSMQEMTALPIPWIECIDVSNAVLWLASDEARYVTGAMISIGVR